MTETRVLSGLTQTQRKLYKWVIACDNATMIEYKTESPIFDAIILQELLIACKKIKKHEVKYYD